VLYRARLTAGCMQLRWLQFVSKDFVNWAALPTAIWNGLDSSVSPPRVTKYDNEAIYTGSAQVFEGAGTHIM
jgi:sucrose-6-phosphate hydrolase SacC (GH32 family)